MPNQPLQKVKSTKPFQIIYILEAISCLRLSKTSFRRVCSVDPFLTVRSYSPALNLESKDNIKIHIFFIMNSKNSQRIPTNLL